VLLAGLSLLPEAARASHIRAGDIQAKIDTTANPNPRRVFFKMVLYLDIVSNAPNPVDQPNVTIFFGDGTSSCADRIPRAVRTVPPGNTDTSVNVYYFEHTYPSSGTFVASFIGENRNRGVINMDQSQDQSFYINTRITIDASLGINHSPVLRAPAIDKGAVGQVFLHSPAAYDADGDSLAFRLRSCQQVPNGVQGTLGLPCPGGTGNNQPAPQPCLNYRYPNDPSLTPGLPPVTVNYNDGSTTTPAGLAAVFRINPRTGLITWNAPVQNGIYNVALVVEEWRRTSLGRRLIGEVLRDMQIIVLASNNLRPTITIPQDICVVAGQRVTGTVTAVDASSPTSPATPITLFAYSGVLPPATFVQTQTGPPTAQGTFSWQTDCSNVAQLPYDIVFKAQDSPNPVTSTNPILIDEKVWRVTVVGPPPVGLTATPNPGTNGNPNSITLNWNTYQCANASRIYIYRKINSSSFVPGPCDTGIPASAGYTRIGSVAANVTTFTDNNVSANGTVLGLDRGQTYCYRIYAEFPLPKGGASIASAEACASLPGRAAMLTNVDIENTSLTAGRILVRWTQPRNAGGAPFPGTSSYELYRAPGLNPAASAFTLVRPAFTSITDTTYVDSGLNTQDLQYTYRLEFVNNPGTTPAVREMSATASSVRTRAIPADATATSVRVTWTYNVPWDNSAQPVAVYRRTGGTGPYVQVGTAPTTATGGTYIDRDPTLRKDETYCYYVQTTGRYGTIPYLSNLVNRSQEHCMVLTSPPCTPVLSLQVTNCDSLASLQEFPGVGQTYVNRLRWTLSNNPTGCDAAVTGYQVFYRPRPTGRFTLLGTTTQTSYDHRNLEFSGGCYAVVALGRSGLASDTSNVACQDNCVFFKLPNIFTPTGDGVNDVFRPKNNSPIRSVHFKAFNRWGVKVFENTTTTADRFFINWDGGGPVGESGTTTKIVDGVYFYLAEVEFADFSNTKRTYKGWVEIVR